MVAGGAPPKAMQLHVSLTVAPGGTVTTSALDGEAPPTLKACVRGHVRSFRFRPTGQITKLGFPVVFQPTVLGR